MNDDESVIPGEAYAGSGMFAAAVRRAVVMPTKEIKGIAKYGAAPLLLAVAKRLGL